MSRQRFLQAALAGLSMAVAMPTGVPAQNLTVLQGTEQAPIDVPLNRAWSSNRTSPFTELSIANPGIADISSLSDRTIYVLGKAPGRTTLTLLGADGRLLANVEVQVTPDVGEFKERLEQILPGQGIEVRTANDGIVLSGTVDSIADLDRALELANRYAPDRVSNLMTVGGTQQVMLQVRFAEMNRNVSKSLGTSLALSSAGDISLVGGTGTGVGGALTPGADARGAVGLAFELGGLEVGLLLEALEQRGLTRTLAEPNLTALSGQEARFLAGGEYPVPVSQDDDTITVQYKPFGVELNFIPRVVDGDLINIELEAAVSSIDPGNGITIGDNFSIDAFRRRETSTTVEMRMARASRLPGFSRTTSATSTGRFPSWATFPSSAPCSAPRSTSAARPSS
jgi:pilus assembly protein CpaC